MQCPVDLPDSRLSLAWQGLGVYTEDRFWPDSPGPGEKGETRDIEGVLFWSGGPQLLTGHRAGTAGALRHRGRGDLGRDHAGGHNRDQVALW